MKYQVPVELPAALLDGFRWDVRGARYETHADVVAYSARVAGTVGLAAVQRWSNGVQSVVKKRSTSGQKAVN